MRIGKGLALAAAIVLVSNCLVLTHVYSNRSGAEKEIVLTQRELPKDYQENDNSGVSLRFNWTTASRQDWLDKSKLQELGFDPLKNREPGRIYDRLLARPVFAAIEYEGQAWQQYLSELPAQSAQFLGSRANRLIPIDAARDAATLRARYPDPAKVLIVPATVHPYLSNGSALMGTVSPLITSINVPLPLNHQVPAGSNPLYAVHLRFGSLREPWVASIQ